MIPGFLVSFLIGSLLIDVQGVFVDVVVDNHATLICKVENERNEQGQYSTAFGPSVQVQWFKKPDRLLSNSLNVLGLYKKRILVKRPYPGEWILVIERVQVTDAGGYICKVSGDVMAEIDLVVQTPPMIHKTNDITFNEGDTGIVWCNATGSPTPNISWYSKPPHQVDGIGQYTGVEGNKLVLHNITRYYDNIYVCVATNTAGNANAETRIHVNFGPEVDILGENVIATMGEEVTLHCVIAAYPMDGVGEWAFQNRSERIESNWKYDVISDWELATDFNTLVVSLTVRQGVLGNQEYGQYVCRTKNFSRGSGYKMVVIQST